MEDEYEYAIETLESDKHASISGIIQTRTNRFPQTSANQIEFCARFDGFRNIVVIGKGSMNRGKKACSLLYSFAGKGKSKLVEVSLYEYDGSHWTHPSSHRGGIPLPGNLVKEINDIVNP